MKAPTRLDLERLLWSDPASDAWEGDAREVLEAPPDQQDFVGEEGPVAAVAELLAVVASEIASPDVSIGDDEAEDLEDLACSAKRGAILLLHAAWFAEQAAARRRRGGQ